MVNIRKLAEENNWRLRDRRRYRPTDNYDIGHATCVVENELVEMLKNGNPLPKGRGLQSDEIYALASLGEAENEADEANRDMGWELYEQHELNGGRELPFRGCWHEGSISVVDGPKNRVSTGNTLVWNFCTDCGSQVGEDPEDFYYVLRIRLRHCTVTYLKDGPHWDNHKEGHVEQWTEVVWWEYLRHPYMEPDLYTVEEATPIIRRAIERRRNSR